MDLTFGADSPLIDHDYPDVVWQDYYELSDIADFATSGPYTKVGIQFPPHLSGDAVTVVRKLRALVKSSRPNHVKFFVLADRTSNSCCVDTVTAEHLGIDAIVHMGRSCGKSPSGNWNVKYVYGKNRINWTQLIKSIASLRDGNEGVQIVTDDPYSHISQRHGGHPFSSLAFGSKTDGGMTVWISDDDQFWERLHLTHPNKTDRIFRFDAGSSVMTPCLTPRGRTLMRRRFKVEQALSCEIFGVHVSALQNSEHLHDIQTVVSRIRSLGKYTYVIFMGNPRTEKLCNFSEVEAWVSVDCPRGQAIDLESATPILKASELISSDAQCANQLRAISNESHRQDVIDFQSGRGAASRYLNQTRTFRGLEIDDISPSEELANRSSLSRGRDGIAAGYKHETYGG